MKTVYNVLTIVFLLSCTDPKDKLGGKQVEEVTQHWSSKIWTFLDHLRSASAKQTGKLQSTDDTGGHSREWKVNSPLSLLGFVALHAVGTCHSYEQFRKSIV